MGLTVIEAGQSTFAPGVDTTGQPLSGVVPTPEGSMVVVLLGKPFGHGGDINISQVVASRTESDPHGFSPGQSARISLKPGKTRRIGSLVVRGY